MENPEVQQAAQAMWGALRDNSRPWQVAADESSGQGSIMVMHLYNGKDRPTRLQATGPSAEAALNRLLLAARKKDIDAKWLRLDVVRGASRVTGDRGQLEPGMTGLMTGVQPPQIWLPLEVPGSILLPEGELKASKLESLDPHATSWLHFGVSSAFCDRNGAVSLSGDHVMAQPERTPDQMLSAAVVAGDYLLRCLQPDGRFQYSYHPIRGKFSTEYNMLRHAGAVYALLELYQESAEPRFLEGAKKALEFMTFSLSDSNRLPGTKVFRDGDSVKLGGNALALLAFSKYSQISGDRQYLPDMVDLAAWMVKNQDPSGRFRVHKESFPEAEDSGFVSGYYSGEALLSLVRLYQLDADERWLLSARRAARYLIDKARKTPEPAHDHWLMIGLQALFEVDPNPDYQNYSWELAETILATQHKKDARPDWEGGFYSPPRSTPTDIRAEGLNAAWAMARESGRTDLDLRLGSGVRKALQFSRLCEVEPPVAILMKEPGYCRGAVMRGLCDPEIRIDYVQHHISALLGACRNTTAP